jgi:hypothetical protein
LEVIPAVAARRIWAGEQGWWYGPILCRVAVQHYVTTRSWNIIHTLNTSDILLQIRPMQMYRPDLCLHLFTSSWNRTGNMEIKLDAFFLKHGTEWKFFSIAWSYLFSSRFIAGGVRTVLPEFDSLRPLLHMMQEATMWVQECIQIMYEF